MSDSFIFIHLKGVWDSTVRRTTPVSVRYTKLTEEVNSLQNTLININKIKFIQYPSYFWQYFFITGMWPPISITDKNTGSPVSMMDDDNKNKSKLEAEGAWKGPREISIDKNYLRSSRHLCEFHISTILNFVSDTNWRTTTKKTTQDIYPNSILSFSLEK